MNTGRDFHSTRMSLEAMDAIKKKDYIPFLGGRPQRETIIQQDEITNLQISLGLCKHVGEFINMYWPEKKG